ncbi:MAG: hypothetical protein ABR588_04390 [Sphingomicrobium sp.]|nr:hypothetical protein [Sphingomonadales bacterium]
MFVELGFGGWEFNCAPLAFHWEGLLVDGDAYNVTIAHTILPGRVQAKKIWLTLETLSIVEDYARGRDIGILSVDVDGNDYWFIERLIKLKPAIIIVEYNSNFGHRSITIPYDPQFYYETGPYRYYSGASLPALTRLAAQNGYSLIAVGSCGINAFFVRNDLLGDDDIPLDPIYAYREQWYDDGLRASQRWEKMKHLPFVEV